MKKLLLFAAVAGFTALNYTAAAQDEQPEVKEKAEKKERKEKKEKKETQEIVIRKNGDKDTKITVEIKGDKVTINGKPISEFKDGDITINKRDIKVWDGHNNFSFSPDDMDIDFNGPLTGSMTHKGGAFLGVTTQNGNDEENSDKKTDGAVITDVSKESAAEKAGLKEADVITKINDKKVEGPQSLSEIIHSFKPKDEVTVYYKRDGKEKSAKVTLGENKSSGAMAYAFSGPNGNVRSFTSPRILRDDIQGMAQPKVWNDEAFGKNFDNLGAINGFNMFPRQKLGLKIQDTEEGGGVKVLDADKDSPAEKAGLKKDDIVTEIAGKKVTNTDEAREQLQDIAEKSAYTIKAKRNGTEMSFDIKIPKKLKTANL
jgi:serine protease Do